MVLQPSLFFLEFFSTSSLGKNSAPYFEVETTSPSLSFRLKLDLSPDIVGLALAPCEYALLTFPLSAPPGRSAREMDLDRAWAEIDMEGGAEGIVGVEIYRACGVCCDERVDGLLADP